MRSCLQSLKASVFGSILLIAAPALAQNVPSRAVPPLGQNNGVVEGRVFSKQEKPVEGIRVGVVPVPDANTPADSGSVIVSLGETDSEGRYRLANIPPGNYLIVAGPLDAPVYFPGVRKTADATPVAVNGIAVVRDQDFHLRAPLTLKVRGKVVGEGRNAATEVGLVPRNQGGAGNIGSRLTAKIAADGSFEFPRVSPGRYDAMVAAGGSIAPLTFLVDEEDVTNLEIAVTLAAAIPTVTFKMTMDGDGPMPRFSLQLETSGSQAWRTVTLTGASSQQRVPAGQYRVRPVPQGDLALPPGFSIKSMTAGGVDLLTQPLNIGTAAIPEIQITLGVSPAAWLKASGRVTGFARDSGITGIQLEGQSIAGYLTAAVNPDGTFSIPKILTGSYQVRLTPNSDSFFRSMTVGNRDLTNAEIPAQVSPHKVEGRIADIAELKQGVLTPAQRLSMILWPEPREAGRPTTTTVAADGSFVFPSVQPGGYRAAVSICESDVCGSTGGISIVVADKDLTGLAVSSNRTGQTTRPGAGATSAVNFVTGEGMMALAVSGIPVGTGEDGVKGTIVVEGGAALPQFRLRFTTGNVTRTLPINSNTFNIDLPQGQYTISVTNLPAGFEVRSITNGADLRSQPLIVGANGGKDVPRVTVTLTSK